MELNNQADKNNDLHQTNPFQENRDNSSNRRYGRPPGNTPKRNNILYIIMIVFLITFLVNLVLANITNSIAQIEYSTFIKLVESGNVARVQIDDTTVVMSLKENAKLTEVEQILYPD